MIFEVYALNVTEGAFNYMAIFVIIYPIPVMVFQSITQTCSAVLLVLAGCIGLK
jgi:hypothetical protein